MTSSFSTGKQLIKTDRQAPAAYASSIDYYLLLAHYLSWFSATTVTVDAALAIS